MNVSDGSVRISTEELKAVLSSLKNQRDLINSEYNNSIRNVLEKSMGCIQVSGLDYLTIISVFDDTFHSLENNFDRLIDVLENDVIKNYSELAVALKKMFGSDFASRLTELLNIAIKK